MTPKAVMRRCRAGRTDCRLRRRSPKGRTRSQDDRLVMPVRRVSQWCRRGSRRAAATLHSPRHRRRRGCRRDFGPAVRRAVNSPLRTLRSRCCRRIERQQGAGREVSGAWRISLIWLHHARALCEQLNSPEGTRVDPGVPCRSAIGFGSTAPCSPGAAARTRLRELPFHSVALRSPAEARR